MEKRNFEKYPNRLQRREKNKSCCFLTVLTLELDTFVAKNLKVLNSKLDQIDSSSEILKGKGSHTLVE